MKEIFSKIFKSTIYFLSFCRLCSKKSVPSSEEIIKNEFKLKIKNPNNIDIYEKAV